MDIKLLQDTINILSIFKKDNLILSTEIKESALFKIYENLEYKFCKAGEILFEKGDEGTKIYFLISGTIQVLKPCIEEEEQPKKTIATLFERNSSLSQTATSLHENMQSMLTRTSKFDKLNSSSENKISNLKKTKKLNTLRTSSGFSIRGSRKSLNTKFTFSGSEGQFGIQNLLCWKASRTRRTHSIESDPPQTHTMAAGHRRSNHMISSIADKILLEYKKEKLSKKKHMKIFSTENSRNKTVSNPTANFKRSFFSSTKDTINLNIDNRLSLSTKIRHSTMSRQQFIFNSKLMSRKLGSFVGHGESKDYDLDKHRPVKKKTYSVNMGNKIKGLKIKRSFFMKKNSFKKQSVFGGFNISDSRFFHLSNLEQRQGNTGRSPSKLTAPVDRRSRLTNQDSLAIPGNVSVSEINPGRSFIQRDHFRGGSRLFGGEQRLGEDVRALRSTFSGSARFSKYLQGTSRLFARNESINLSQMRTGKWWNRTSGFQKNNLRFEKFRSKMQLGTIESNEPENSEDLSISKIPKHQLLMEPEKEARQSKEAKSREASQVKKKNRNSGKGRTSRKKKKPELTKQRTKDQLNLIMQIHNQNSFAEESETEAQAVEQKQSKPILSIANLKSIFEKSVAKAVPKDESILIPHNVHPNFKKKLKEEGDRIVKETLLSNKNRRIKESSDQVFEKKKSNQPTKEIKFYNKKQYKLVQTLSPKKMIGQTGVIFDKPRNSSIGCKTNCHFAMIRQCWIKDLIGRASNARQGQAAHQEDLRHSPRTLVSESHFQESRNVQLLLFLSQAEQELRDHARKGRLHAHLLDREGVCDGRRVAKARLSRTSRPSCGGPTTPNRSWPHPSREWPS